MDHIIDPLFDLLESCRDGEYGFRAIAEHASGAMLRHTFSARAEACAAAADELQAQARQRGSQANGCGTPVGDAEHRGWVAMKGMLASSGDLALLEEALRGEELAIKRYRGALAHPWPPQLRAVIERLLAGAMRNYALMCALCDREWRAPGV